MDKTLKKIADQIGAMCEEHIKKGETTPVSFNLGSGMVLSLVPDEKKSEE